MRVEWCMIISGFLFGSRCSAMRHKTDVYFSPEGRWVAKKMEMLKLKESRYSFFQVHMFSRPKFKKYICSQISLRCENESLAELRGFTRSYFTQKFQARRNELSSRQSE